MINGNLTGVLNQKLSNINHFIGIANESILLSGYRGILLIVLIALILAADTLDLSWTYEFLQVLLQEFLSLSDHVGLFLGL